jgi:MraZ protein
MFGDVMQKLQIKVEEGEAEPDVARLFQSAAWDVQLDGQGRFVVPMEHRAHGGIDREVKVIGHNNRVEIWDASRFDGMQTERSADDVSAAIGRLRIF